MERAWGSKGRAGELRRPPTPSSAVPGQQAWLEVPDREEAPDGSGETQLDGHEGLMPKQTFCSHHLLLYK